MSKDLSVFGEFLIRRQADWDKEILESWKPVQWFLENPGNGCYMCGHLEESGLNKQGEWWVCDGCGVRMGILEP